MKRNITHEYLQLKVAEFLAEGGKIKREELKFDPEKRENIDYASEMLLENPTEINVFDMI